MLTFLLKVRSDLRGLAHGGGCILCRLYRGRFFLLFLWRIFKAIAAEFGDSRLGVSIGTTVTMGAGAIMAPFIDRALDLYPLKIVMATGAVSMGLGFLLLGFVVTPGSST